MRRNKKNIKRILREGAVTPDELENRTKELVDTAKKSLGLTDDKAAKDYVAGFIGETDDVSEVNQDVLDNFIDQYGKDKGEGIYYATANKQDRDPDTFQLETDDEIVSRGIQYGINPELEGDKYQEYRELMAKLSSEEGGDEQLVNEEKIPNIPNKEWEFTQFKNDDDGTTYVVTKYKGKYYGGYAFMEPGSVNSIYDVNDIEAIDKEEYNNGIEESVVTEALDTNEESSNDPVKLKSDVSKLLSKLDMSSIEPYMDKIDNPIEQAEVISQFAEKIGVPKSKLSSVITQLKTVSENSEIKMSKSKLIETITGRKIVKIIKVKDLK
jgi:hypothetical protein